MKTSLMIVASQTINLIYSSDKDYDLSTKYGHKKRMAAILKIGRKKSLFQQWKVRF
ncbi:hypothetical protein [Spiroplasma endosymbiont of Lariophagus distinguendus]|uniref:hypothetical protein n=1 Tax=Spiroplasma endosymbiont of Lariophagus distinguendus TaxID=2935082 RepID=UPI0020793DAF|nr:hypothetical protein [Spiroplasma endosymbiont of Lariophagus distinguendus]